MAVVRHSRWVTLCCNESQCCHVQQLCWGLAAAVSVLLHMCCLHSLSCAVPQQQEHSQCVVGMLGYGTKQQHFKCLSDFMQQHHAWLSVQPPRVSGSTLLPFLVRVC